MVSSIGGSSSMLHAMYAKNIQPKVSPEEKFSELDTDGDAVLSASELKVVAEEVAARSGQSLNIDEMITSYDVDGDAMLDQSEMDTMMQDVMENVAPPPPPEDSSAMVMQALSAYQENQGEDGLATLLEQLGSTEMVPPPPPSPEEKFNELDSDGDGVLSVDELEAATEELSSLTGQNIDSEEALATYDADGDGALSMDEMDSMMSDLREELGPPPNMKEGGSMADALAAYLAESDENTMDTILEILGKYSGNSEQSSQSGVNIEA